MRFWTILLLTGAAFGANAPTYSDSGELVRPPDYREWIYLTSGVGMTYGPARTLASGGVPLFDNVFVKRESYQAFLESGHWPDKTMFVLEIRYPQTHGSINKDGYFQTDVAAMEVALKDETRFPEKWAYFNFETRGGVPAPTAKPLPKTAGCFACHTANGAVENTFVQFYPTLLAVAREKGTVKASLKPWSPSPAAIYHLAESGKWEQAKRELEQARVEEPEAMSTREMSLNTIAYQLLAANHKNEAAEVLRYARTVYPQSANLADSLSEILEAEGKTAEALATAKEALTLLEKDPALAGARREPVEKALQERIARLEARQ